MAPAHENAPHSDTETGEKPVREQLKKASIAGMPEEAKAAALAEAATSNGEDVEARGRLQRKRSFEEVEGVASGQAAAHGQAEGEKGKQHTRKRSRDSKEEDEEEALHDGKRLSGERSREREDAEHLSESTNGAAARRAGTPEKTVAKGKEEVVEAMTSPKTKRSRIHSSATEGENATRTTETTTETKTSGPAQVPPGSGFANTSASSPFASLGSATPSSKPEQQPQTSASAFASSGFGSMASSSTSGFGAIGKNTGGFGAGGGFATGSKSPVGGTPGTQTSENEKPAAETAKSGSTFGGALGQKSPFSVAPSANSGSAFGSTPATGFGTLGGATSGSAFGGSLGTSAFSSLSPSPAGGLTSFASGKPTPASSTPKPAKPFGAPPDPEEEEGGGEGGEEGGEDASGSGAKSPGLTQEEDKQDERFYAQQVETGEEEEETAYSCRAKLYEFAELDNGEKGWRERGLGVLRYNVHYPRDPGAEGLKVKSRFLMRADGSHRVVLNTPIKKEIGVGTADGGPPQGGLMLFMGTIDGKTRPQLLQLKVRVAFRSKASRCVVG